VGLGGPIRPTFAGSAQNVGAPAGPSRPHFASPEVEEQAFYQNVSQSELFHATPRISGTPAGNGGESLSPGGGPEKPQRQWAYSNNGRPPQQLQQSQQQLQEQQTQQQTPSRNGPQPSNRVRFQEPEATVSNGSNWC